MDGTQTINDNDVLFQFKTYEEFRTARLKLNYESSLKLWYSLPSDLASINNKQCRRQTLRQQRTRFRNLKLFAFYSALLRKTFLKKRIRSKGKQNKK